MIVLKESRAINTMAQHPLSLSQQAVFFLFLLSCLLNPIFSVDTNRESSTYLIGTGIYDM